MINKAFIAFNSILLFLMVGSHSLIAQTKDSTRISVEASADLVSSFLWRGVVSDMKPNIQPSITFTDRNFEAGIWGSSNFDNTYREVDYWISWSLKSFKLTFNDYFWTPNIDSLEFFNWNDKTGHCLEGVLEWEGPESFPLKLTAATFFYGQDKKVDHIDPVTKEEHLKNQYSSYFEASYPFQIKKTEVNITLGGTPTKGFYADGGGLVNFTISAKKYIPLTDKFSLPVTGSFILNPKLGNAYIVFGISL